jgi:hypothetical protein
MERGKGIRLKVFGFVAFILTLVFTYVCRGDIELVTDNYFENKIYHQDQIDRENSAATLDREVLVFDPSSKIIYLDLPVGVKGNLLLFCLSDARLNQNLPIKIFSEGKIAIPTKNLKAGFWRVQLTWTENGVEFFVEEKINF